MTNGNESAGKGHKLAYLLVLLGAMTPAGYIVGLSYHQGYLSAFGVDGGAFPLSTQEAYVQGYYATVFLGAGLINKVSAAIHWVLTPKGAFTFLGAISSIALVIYWLIKMASVSWSEFSSSIGSRLKNIFAYLHWRDNDFTKALSVTSVISYLLFFVIYALTLLAIIWIFAPYAAYTQGFSVAEERLEAYLEKGCVVEKGKRFSNCRVLRDANGKVVHRGLLVAYSNSSVAFFSGGRSFVSSLPKGATLISEIPEDALARKQ